MFEEKIIPAGCGLSDAGSEFGADGLRPLGWQELVARLGAARDFRRVMQAESGARGGSFDHASARLLTAFEQGQRGINSFALTNRKIDQSKEDMVSNVMKTGDRGRA